MNLLESYLHRYLNLGWSVIPISPRDKKPLVNWRKFQTTKATHAQADEWARRWPSAGLACITGKLSGVFVIDQDSQEGEAIANVLPETATVQTQKGKHYYFQMPEHMVPGVKVRFHPGLDLRGEGGYAILPPSVHPDGHWYAWDIPPEEGIAQCPPDVLKAVMAAHGEVESTSSGGWRLALEGVAEGGRNNAAAVVIGKYLSDTDEDKWPIILDAVKYWNGTKNTPPLPEAELQTTFDSIANKERHKRKRKDPVEITDEQLDAVELPPLRWAIHGLIPDGFTILVAPPKAGKSILLLDWALGIAGDRPQWASDVVGSTLGAKYELEHGHVIYLDLEDSQRRIQTRSRELRAGGPSVPRLHYITEFPSLYEGGISALERMVDKYEARVVIIDTLGKFLGMTGGNEKGNAYTAQYRMLTPLHDLTKRHPVAVILVHHTKKGKIVSYTDAISGTLGMTATVDTYMVLDRKEGTPLAKLFVQGRDVETQLLKMQLEYPRGWSLTGKDLSL